MQCTESICFNNDFLGGAHFVRPGHSSCTKNTSNVSDDCKDQISFRAHEESFGLQVPVIVKQY